MPSTQSPAGGASAAGCAAGAAGAAVGGVSAGGVGACAYAAGMVAAMLAAAIQHAAPIRFLYPMVALVTFAHTIHFADTNVGRRQSGAPRLVLASEELFAVQHQVEALAFLVLAHTQADQHLGDHQQDQRADAAVDQCRSDTLALDPELRQPARAAVRSCVGRR